MNQNKMAAQVVESFLVETAAGVPSADSPPKWLFSKCEEYGGEPQECARAWKAVFLKRPDISSWPVAVQIWKNYIKDPKKVEEIERAVHAY